MKHYSMVTSTGLNGKGEWVTTYRCPCGHVSTVKKEFAMPAESPKTEKVTCPGFWEWVKGGVVIVKESA